MSGLESSVATFLARLASLQAAYAAGSPGMGTFPFLGFDPETLHSAVSRDALHTLMQEMCTTPDATSNIGKLAMTTDSADIMAAFERSVQRVGMGRTRHMAHALSRAKGQADPAGLIPYSIQEVMVRPDE